MINNEINKDISKPICKYYGEGGDCQLKSKQYIHSQPMHCNKDITPNHCPDYVPIGSSGKKVSDKVISEEVGSDNGEDLFNGGSFHIFAGVVGLIVGLLFSFIHPVVGIPIIIIAGKVLGAGLSRKGI